MAQALSDYFTENAVLNDSSIQNTKNFIIQLQQLVASDENTSTLIDKNGKAKTDSLAQTFNLNGWEEAKQIISAAAVSLDPIMKYMCDLENMDKNTENYKLTLDATQQIIKQTQLSVSDLKFVYDHWDLAANFISTVEKK